MSINEIMKIGTDGMSTAQKQEERERRISISQRINLIQVRMLECEKEAKKCEKGSKAEKMLRAKVRKFERELRKIKADEGVWLREAAWFMYA